ncbi:MAG TPA: hypothetical protein VFQ35_22790 [Polyangiaceae bacterium]|nr:hypothetical protein [Polyangiaceae bacterium]
MLLAVAIASLAVLFGLLLGLAPAASRRALGPLRTLALTAVIGVVALHLLPEALRDLGAVGLLVFAIGLALPRWLNALRAKRPHAHGEHEHARGDELGLDLGFFGLLAHHVGDGLALGAYSRAGATHGHPHGDVLLALVLHTVPLVAVVAAGYARTRGVRVAVTRAAWLAVASIVGVLCSHLVPESIVDRTTAWIAAGVSGLLLHGLTHDLELDLPRAPAAKSFDLAMALLGAAVGILGAKLGAHADRAAEARLRLALLTELDRVAVPLACGLALGALLALGRSPKVVSLLGFYRRASRPERGGVLTPEAFLLTLSHFGFPIAVLRDAVSGIGFALRGASPEEALEDATIGASSAGSASAESAVTSAVPSAFARVDTIVPWAALGVLVSAVIRASVPDFALASSLWLAIPVAILLTLSVKVHAVAAPSLAYALADRGLPMPAAIVALVLLPFALDLRNGKQALFLLIPVAFAFALGDRLPHAPLVIDSRIALVAASGIGALLLARSYELGFRGVLLTILKFD